MPQKFTPENYYSICDELAVLDPDLKKIIDHNGYPVMWSRPNTFESLVHIILEQQVSLASALSALNKLKEKIQEVTPEKVLSMSDIELRECYFSRQKTVYVRYLAASIDSGQTNLSSFEYQENEEIRRELIKLKGIGNWTIDIYLMMILHRTDVFPSGDLAAITALKRIKSPSATRENLISLTENWKPYRTVATMLLWHYYLSKPGIKI